MTDPHRLILGPVPRIVDPKTVRDLLRTPGPGPSPVLPRPMPTTVPDDAWPLDHRSIRCRDPTRKPILHIAPQRLIRCQLGWLRPFGGSISMPLRRRCSGSPGHRFGSPRCAAPRGRSSTVLAPAGKQYDVCLFPGRAEEQSPHVPRKTGKRPDSGLADCDKCDGGMPPDLRKPPRAYRRGYTASRPRPRSNARRNRCPEPNKLLTPCRVRSTWRMQLAPSRPIRPPVCVPS